MPQTPHIERHFTSSEAVRDIVIGMADGLTVPFALAAGLSGAIKATHVIVVAGLAEIAAGSIAMGLGGYLAARSDAEHYEQERGREWREVKELPDEEAREVSQILQNYGMAADEAGTVVAALEKRPEAWVDFMMRFELGLEPPEPGRAVRSAGTIAVSYVAGGLIPLAPYIILNQASTAFAASVGVTLMALAAFGYIKGRFTGAVPIRSASQTLVTGALAAAAAYVLARLIS
ncbi:MAG: VIT1/CCC1 transporter family protein [Terriglobales bacterium]